MGELADVALWCAEVDPGVAGVVEDGLERYLDSRGSEFLSCPEGVVNEEPGYGTGCEVPVDRTVATEDLDLAAVRQLQDPEVREFQVETQAQQVPKKATVGSACSVRVPLRPAR